MNNILILFTAAALAGPAQNFSKGIESFRKERYEQAVLSFEQIIDEKVHGPLLDDALYWRGMCRWKQKNTKGARADFGRLLKEYPGSEYVAEAMKHFLAVGGKKESLIDRSTPEKLWQSFCRAVVEGDGLATLTCLGGELKQDVRTVLENDPEAFWVDAFRDLARMRTMKVEKKGDSGAVLWLGLAGKGKGGGMFGLRLAKFAEGWIIEDAMEKEPGRRGRANAVPPVRHAGKTADFKANWVSWPETALRADQKLALDRLSKQLGSDSFMERETAVKDIIEMGPVAGREMEKLTDADDPEVRARARRIITRLREILTDSKQGGTNER